MTTDDGLKNHEKQVEKSIKSQNESIYVNCFFTT